MSVVRDVKVLMVPSSHFFKTQVVDLGGRQKERECEI